MSIRAEKHNVIIDSVTYEVVYWEMVNPTKEELDKYLKKHPFPNDPAYPKDDFVDDITIAVGFISLPDGIKKETERYIVELIDFYLFN